MNYLINCINTGRTIVFAAQMIATNNFNSVFKIDIDKRLLPIKDEFKPATWRKNCEERD